MTLYAIYETATGALTGSSSCAAPPPLPVGYAAMAVPAGTAIDPDVQYIAGGALKDRKVATMAAVTVLVGDSVSIAVPAGANWDLDGAYYIGPRSMSFSASGSHVVTLRGAWRGRMTVTATTLAEAKAALIAKIDARREDLLSAAITTGGAIGDVYAKKSIERDKASGIVATLLNSLSTTDKSDKYPFAYEESLRTGDTLSVVLARFATGIKAANAKQSKIEAVAQQAKRAIAAATTIAGATTAATVTWP